MHIHECGCVCVYIYLWIVCYFLPILAIRYVYCFLQYNFIFLGEIIMWRRAVILIYFNISQRHLHINLQTHQYNANKAVWFYNVSFDWVISLLNHSNKIKSQKNFCLVFFFFVGTICLALLFYVICSCVYMYLCTNYINFEV